MYYKNYLKIKFAKTKKNLKESKRKKKKNQNRKTQTKNTQIKKQFRNLSVRGGPSSLALSIREAICLLPTGDK